MSPFSSSSRSLTDSHSPYRAPELLFGARTYDPYAVDMWSLGCTFAEFFTPLLPEDDEDEDYYPPELCDANPTLVRKALFDGTRGEIGLAWSIFKILGTPTEDSWPVGLLSQCYLLLLDNDDFVDIQTASRRFTCAIHCRSSGTSRRRLTTSSSRWDST